ncbi:putative amidase At4g34880 [Tasmannia lanceolata]|uniref:putative amidase At4g34880 n=1 Tax=Tasmannia lanceolata TaxID=3420 RepID=UPI00406323B0
MKNLSSMAFQSTLFLLLLAISLTHEFKIKEATIQEIHQAFNSNKVTSRQLVEFYLKQIQALNPVLRAVIEVNPDALNQANVADEKRRASGGNSAGLEGIPILLKDNIGTKDRLNTTAGSLALVGSVVGRDSGVVERLRRAESIILGKASLSEWAHFRDFNAPSGWCARSGQGKNQYVLPTDPCGLSSGSAIAVPVNKKPLSLSSLSCRGSQTHLSRSCLPTTIVGNKATFPALTIIFLYNSPICRTVSDAVYVLNAIIGFDSRDAEATREAAKFIPSGGYTQFLKTDGLKGKRLGILRKPFFDFYNGTVLNQAFEKHFITLKQRGAILFDHIEIANVDIIGNSTASGEDTALNAEFKLSLNAYLLELVRSPVRSLADIIAFNIKFSAQEKIDEFGQGVFLAAEATNGFGEAENKAIEKMKRLSRDGLERLMKEKKLDALVTPGADASAILAIGGFPGISVPAGYGNDGVPFGICFGGLRGSEPKLIEIAYSFEQATKVRKPPSFKPGSLYE